MAITIKPVNGRLELYSSAFRFGGLSDGIAVDEAVNMSQLNAVTARLTAIEEGTESLTIVEVDNGSVTAPSITFASDLNTGIYRIGADNFAFTAGGSKIVDVTTAGISITGTITASTTLNAGTLVLAGNGAVGAPSFSFTSDTNTGIYRIGADNFALACNGAKVVDVLTTGVAITGLVSSTTTVTAGTLLVSGNGAVGAPAHTFTNDLDSGLYYIGANNIGFSAGGNKVLDIGTSGLGVTGSLSTSTYFLTGDGSVGAPAQSFISDTDCGTYRIGANNLGVAVAGAKVLDVATTGLAVTGLISATTSVAATTTVTAGTLVVAGNGAVGAPAFTFTNDLDSGIYYIGANNLGVAVAGAKVLDVATTGTTTTGTISTSAGFLYTPTITVDGAGTPQTLNQYAGTVTMTGIGDIVADASANVVINNSLVTASTVGLVALQYTTAAAGSTPRIENVAYGAGTITITIRNSDSATATGAAAYRFSFILFKL